MHLRGFVVFLKAQCGALVVDFRVEGQCLPAGSIPLYAEDWQGKSVTLHGFAAASAEDEEVAWLPRAKALFL